MQFGDQLGDFVDAAANTAAARGEAAAANLDWVGTRWFMLPNPTYGAWQSVLFGNNRKAPAGERRRQTLAVVALPLIGSSDSVQWVTCIKLKVLPQL